MNKDHKNFEVFFIDLDGTALNWQSKMHPKNIAKIKEVIASGKHVVFSTGRLGRHVEKFMELTGVKYAVTGNGSVIVKYPRTIIHQYFISLEESKIVFDFVIKNKLIIKLDADEVVYGVSTKIIKETLKWFSFTALEHYDFDKTKKYNKFFLWGKNPKSMEKVYQELKTRLPNLSVILTYKKIGIEITNKNATKGMGNHYLAKNIFKINDRNKIVHIGDSMNDITAKKYCKLIAMQNGPKELKKIADYIGPHFKNGGLAKVLAGNYKNNLKY